MKWSREREKDVKRENSKGLISPIEKAPIERGKKKKERKLA